MVLTGYYRYIPRTCGAGVRASKAEKSQNARSRPYYQYFSITREADVILTEKKQYITRTFREERLVKGIVYRL